MEQKFFKCLYFLKLFHFGCYFKMTLRKILSSVVGLLLIIAVVFVLTSVSHPIILKWLSGSARLVGRPANAMVFADGRISKDIKVFHVDKYWNGEPADYYILYFPYADNSRLQFLSLNRKDNYAGGPSSTNKRDYDIIAGLLFQSEVGAKFTPIQDDIKGFNHEPQLAFKDRQITLIIPPTAKELNCDSLCVVL
jgi:hypothetical protein